MIRLAVFQMQSRNGDLLANLAAIEDAALKAVDEGANLLVTPELSLHGYGAGSAFDDLALTSDNNVFTELRALSVKIGISLVVGFAERAGRIVYNSAAYISGANPLVLYRKSHLYGDYERRHFTASKPLTAVFEEKGLKIGILICYDVEFPENVRRLAQAGADLILVPTALPDGEFGEFIARQLVPVRAFENQIFVAYTNHCGNDGVYEYKGLSCIAAPDGSLLDIGDEKEERLLIADIEPNLFSVSKNQNRYLTDL